MIKVNLSYKNSYSYVILYITYYKIYHLSKEKFNIFNAFVNGMSLAP